MQSTMFRVSRNSLFSLTKSFTCRSAICGAHSINVSGREIDAEQPLTGVRILDLTRIVAGPYCTMLLADLGAEVIKIERPGGGDEARKWGPPWVNNSKESCYFLPVNRNKHSVCIDIKSKAGKEIICDLAKEADVLIENYVPGKLSGMGLGYEDLKAIAPKLIYCSISG